MTSSYKGPFQNGTHVTRTSWSIQAAKAAATASAAHPSPPAPTPWAGCGDNASTSRLGPAGAADHPAKWAFPCGVGHPSCYEYCRLNVAVFGASFQACHCLKHLEHHCPQDCTARMSLSCTCHCVRAHSLRPVGGSPEDPRVSCNKGGSSPHRTAAPSAAANTACGVRPTESEPTKFGALGCEPPPQGSEAIGRPFMFEAP